MTSLQPWPWRAAAALLALSVASCNRVADGDARSEQPNLIVFMVDDLGWQDVSLPLWTEATDFNRRYRTPNLERLAAEGVTFTRAYASAPVCTPTRTSLMTGQAPARTHITYWTLHADRDTSRERPDLAAPDWRMNGLRAGEPTLPALLSRHGYRTIHVGKAHFGAHETSGADPLALGFDVNSAGHASGAPASYLGKHSFSRAGRTGDPDAASVWDVPGLEAYHGEEVFLTEALTTEALRAVREAHEASRPFFLNFCPYAVHTPLMANERLLEHYPGLDQREARYATMIESVDVALGALLDELERLGIADETLVVFTSDNGGLSATARGGEPHTHNAPLRSGKGSAYEGGIRVPTVVRFPGRARSGVRDTTPIVTHDFFPTLLEAAGHNASELEEAGLDGVDLTPLLADGVALAPRTLGWNQPHQWGVNGPGIEPFTAIRRGQWKLIFFHAGPRLELYDLEADVAEQHDLAPERPELLRELSEHMRRWIEDTGAQLSIDKATGVEVELPATPE